MIVYVDKAREVLRQFVDRKVTVTGVIERFGISKQHNGKEHKFPALMLRNPVITVGKTRITLSHIWIVLKGEKKYLDLEVGDVIQLEARVNKYYKLKSGHLRHKDLFKRLESYGLSEPRNFKVVGKVQISSNSKFTSLRDTLKEII